MPENAFGKLPVAICTVPLSMVKFWLGLSPDTVNVMLDRCAAAVRLAHPVGNA